MPFRIAFAGVHGSGKSTTAVKLAEVLSKKYKRSVLVVELEAIDVVKDRDAVERQLYFMSKFMHDYLLHFHDDYDFIVYTSHPLMTVPYTEWFCQYALTTVVHSALVLDAPKPDLLVHLRVRLPQDLGVLEERIKARNRSNRDEELDTEYISFIVSRTETYTNIYKRKLNVDVLDVPARIELNERVERILGYLKHGGVINEV